MTSPKLKVEEKKRGNWPVVVLLAVTVGLSLVFYLKNVPWSRLNVKISFDWLENWWGTETMTLEK